MIDTNLQIEIFLILCSINDYSAFIQESMLVEKDYNNLVPLHIDTASMRQFIICEFINMKILNVLIMLNRSLVTPPIMNNGMIHIVVILV